MDCRGCGNNKIIKAGLCHECYDRCVRETRDASEVRRSEIELRLRAREGDILFGNIWFWVVSSFLAYTLAFIGTLWLDDQHRLPNSLFLAIVGLCSALIVLTGAKLIIEVIMAQDFEEMRSNPLGYLTFHSLYTSYPLDGNLALIIVIVSLLILVCIPHLVPDLDFEPWYKLINRG